MTRFALLAVLAVAAIGCAAPTLQEAQLTQSAYNGEDYSYGIAPTSQIHGTPYDSPTPQVIDGAKTITTPQLRTLMLSAQPPILIDVIGGNQTFSLPGATWARGAGLAGRNAEAKLAADLTALTGSDKTKSIVFFCLSKTCWLSHNAAVGAVALGYTNVYWYRGGRDAWIAAGLPTAPYRGVLQ
jgi:PQQ-dependent catabolism-associated CXXCW motif protein